MHEVYHFYFPLGPIFMMGSWWIPIWSEQEARVTGLMFFGQTIKTEFFMDAFSVSCLLSCWGSGLLAKRSHAPFSAP